jgi:hypothetical protein
MTDQEWAVAFAAGLITGGSKKKRGRSMLKAAYDNREGLGEN